MADAPIAPQPPPPLPNMPDVGPALTSWLQSFSLWCRHGFASKVDRQSAAPGILLQANDAAAGTVPKVYLLQVNSAGTISAVAQPLGSGRP